MQDIQNTIGNYKFKINKVGVQNLIAPFRLVNRSGQVMSSIGSFSLGVSLRENIKGINMSRLSVILNKLDEENWTVKNMYKDMKEVLVQIARELESEDSFMDIEFPFICRKKAPVTGQEGIMDYKCRIRSELHKGTAAEDYKLTLVVEVPVTTLCPCSKAISQYSAHNQRGYVEVWALISESMNIKEIIEMVEAVGSCELYPVLKRPDEKFVTEKAYENPRFVEDIVRLAAEKLYEDQRVLSFKVSSKHQESIHAHDAIAVIEVDKR
jgi:GTP cyclohydrolase IB